MEGDVSVPNAQCSSTLGENILEAQPLGSTRLISVSLSMVPGERLPEQLCIWTTNVAR